MRRLLFILMTLMTANGWTADIRLPAENLADVDEGTVEFWLKVDDVGDLGQGFHGLGRPFAWTDKGPTGRTAGLDISVFQKNGQTSIRVGVGEDKTYAPPMLINLSKPMSVWHHVAVTWRGREVIAYLDGKRQGDRELGQAWEMEASRAEIRFGTAKMQVDDLCISSVARTEEQLAGTLKISAATLLMMTFDGEPVVAVPNVDFSALKSLKTVAGRDGNAGDFNSLK